MGNDSGCLRMTAQIQPGNSGGPLFIRFLRHLLRHLRGPVALLWDGGTIHRRVIVHDFLRKHKRLHVHRFPSYAPELNPDEFVWTKVKPRCPMVRHTTSPSLGRGCAVLSTAFEGPSSCCAPVSTRPICRGNEPRYIH